jgi:hypothetical protein
VAQVDDDATVPASEHPADLAGLARVDQRVGGDGMGARRAGLAIVAALVVVAACGGTSTGSTPTGGAAATNGQGGATPGSGGSTPGAQATSGDQATPGSAGGGSHPAGWDQFGKVSFQISGPVPKSGELGFVPAGSRFGGTAGTTLSFLAPESDEVLTMTISNGQALGSYGAPDLTIAAATCTTTDLKIDATSASGSFDCSGGAAINAAGDTLQGVTLKGSFTAHT